MTNSSAIVGNDEQDEIAALVRQLHETQKQLGQLTGGEVDAVLHPDGQSYLLHEAQEQLQLSESAQRHLAEMQVAILNALPARIALIDARGIILSTNESWRRFATGNTLHGPEFGMGQNYLDVCERATGDGSEEANATAAGIRRVLNNEAADFTMEYPCHSPTEQCWFLVRVAPMHKDKSVGAVVMHIDVTEQKLAVEGLRESEERFRSMFIGAASGIAISTAQGKYLQANAAYCRMLGYTEGELQTMNFASVTHPDDLTLNLGMRDELLAGQRESLIMEKRYTNKNGGIVWAQTSVSATHKASGELATLIVIAEDISERKLAEEQLRAKTAVLEAQVDSTLDGILILDSEGNKILQNQRMVELWNIPRAFADDSNDQRQREWVTKQVKYPQKFAEKIAYFNAHPDEIGGDELELADGRCFDRYSSPVKDKEGKHYGRIWALRDITERKQAEVEIRFNEQRYRSLVEATTAIVWDTPASGEFTVEQPGWTAFTGQTFDELRGWGWLNAIHPEDRAETERVWSEAVASRTSYKIEHRLQTHDKSYRDMLVRAVPILGDDGAIRQWIGIHTDISERKKLERQFLRAQRMESIGTLAGGIAHDLNNALAPIMMSIDLLRMKFPDQASQELLATLSASAHRGADMVRQVLSFARGVEGRHMEVQPSHVIKDVEKIAKDTFFKNIQIRTMAGNNLWTIMGDPTQVHQVLLNLCVNARDAMPDGGTLTLSAENIRVDEHYAGLIAEAKSGPYLLIQIEDTGSGMPPGVIEKIFDPFFTTKELGKGTGLGLSTSLAIVKSHGGFMRVYSEMGKGTKFKVYFPAQTDVSSEKAEEIAAEMPRGNGEIILVVDDEASVRQITQQTLQAFGYRVILASDGVEALSIFARQGPEIAVVLTDMMMPVMDGPALIRVLRKLNLTLPIIGAGGLSGSKHISESGNVGMNHFLPKPYMANELLKILREILTTKPRAPSLNK